MSLEQSFVSREGGCCFNWRGKKTTIPIYNSRLPLYLYLIVNSHYTYIYYRKHEEPPVSNNPKAFGIFTTHFVGRQSSSSEKLLVVRNDDAPISFTTEW